MRLLVHHKRLDVADTIVTADFYEAGDKFIRFYKDGESMVEEVYLVAADEVYWISDPDAPIPSIEKEKTADGS